MRRAVLGLAGLAAGTTLLVVVKGAAASGPAAPPPVLAGPTGTAPSGPVPPSADPATPSPAPSATPADEPAPSARPSRSAPAGQPTRTGAAPGPARTTPAAPPTAAGPHKVTGPVAANDYGAVQVQITVTGDRITEIRTLEMPESSSRSSQLSARAEPLLRAEALREQGADLDTVSGATYTSQSYRESLQGAIDAAARGERG
ncbi:FMN-binding protein [Polymorphospora sp. NPDC050346]|uniref:FMN-binding protein n=1 Tax=Polymorphospora sp. NPDC050346 TaxID=3155780 RepID=UPI0033EB6749